MSECTTPPEVTDPAADPVGYVKRAVWPPLPTAYGVWLGDLIHRAAHGASPELELAVPEAVLDTQLIPPMARRDPDGTVVITLGAALTLFSLEDLLYPDDAEHAEEPVVLFSPEVARTLANTADAHTFATTFDFAQIHALVDTLHAGEWDYRQAAPVRVDRAGRVESGLNTLLAIVMANTTAAALSYEDTPASDTPLTWRGPAGWGTWSHK